MKGFPVFPVAAIVVMLSIGAYAIISSGNDDDTSPPNASATDFPVGAKAVQFLSPLPGVVTNPVTLSFVVGNAALVPAGDTSDPDGGHLHIFIDREPPGAGETIVAGDGIIDMSDGSNEVTLPNLSPGDHVISAVFTDTNHVVWNPAPVVTGTFTVE